MEHFLRKKNTCSICHDDKSRQIIIAITVSLSALPEFSHVDSLHWRTKRGEASWFIWFCRLGTIFQRFMLCAHDPHLLKIRVAFGIQFCPCHDSSAVVTRRKLWSDWTTGIKTSAFKQYFNCEHMNSLWNHDNIFKCKHFPRCWPFVRGIHRSPRPVWRHCNGVPDQPGD